MMFITYHRHKHDVSGADRDGETSSLEHRVLTINTMDGETNPGDTPDISTNTNNVMIINKTAEAGGTKAAQVMFRRYHQVIS